MQIKNLKVDQPVPAYRPIELTFRLDTKEEALRFACALAGLEHGEEMQRVARVQHLMTSCTAQSIAAATAKTSVTSPVYAVLVEELERQQMLIKPQSGLTLTGHIRRVLEEARGLL